MITKDIIVKPEFQGKGIGTEIIKSIMNYLESEAEPNAFIGLMAVPGTIDFYKQFGLISVPMKARGWHTCISKNA